MSVSEVQLRALLVGFAVFAVLIGVLLTLRLRRERAGHDAGRLGPDGRHAANDDPSEMWTRAGETRRQPDTGPSREGESPISTVVGARADAEPGPELNPRTERRRPEPPPLPSPAELASAVRSSIMRAVSERVPVGWSALVLCPPPHPELMTWHVHLSPEVALDLQDGRVLAAAAPLPSHEWQLAGGRTVRIGDGDPEPAPTDETIVLRVTGPYLIVAASLPAGRPPDLVARLVSAEDDELPQQRAVALEPRSVQAALREAVEQAVGSRMLGPPPTVGYRRPSWNSHERVWLTISG